MNQRYAPCCITWLIIVFVLFVTPLSYLLYSYNTPKKACTVEYSEAYTSVYNNNIMKYNISHLLLIVGKGTTDPLCSAQFPMEEGEVERNAPYYDDNERERLLPANNKRPVVPYHGQPSVSGTINSTYESENLIVYSNHHLQTSRRCTSSQASL